MAHTDGTRVVQYQSDDQNSMKTTIMQMPTDYLEIMEPALPRGFLELAEEARNVYSVESGQSCSEEVQSQGAGLTRPVFVTVMEYSSSVLREGAMIAPGTSTDMIPTTLSAGRRNPVDQLGLVGLVGPVGPYVTVDQIQPVAEGLVGQYITPRQDGMFSTCDSDQPMADGPVGRFITRSPVGSDGILSTCDSDQPVADSPVGQSFILDPVGPDVTVDQIQPVAEGPVGQYITRRPDGMFSTCDSDQPMVDGPVGRFITRSPVGSDGMLSTCDSDQPVALDKKDVLPSGPRRMFSQCKPNQPVDVGPVGQSFTPGPVGPCEMVS